MKLLKVTILILAMVLMVIGCGSPSVKGEDNDDSIPPETEITGGPTGTIKTNRATFTWEGTDNEDDPSDLEFSYELSKGGQSHAQWSNWTSDTSKEFRGLTSGQYTFKVKAKDSAGNEDPTPATRTFKVDYEGPTTGLTNLFFLHHSTGEAIIDEGNMRGYFDNYNNTHGTDYEFWDHGYNDDGLRDPDGDVVGCYNIPDDNTDPDGLYYLWTSSKTDAVNCRNQIMSNHEVIAFKSCFPASDIPDEQELNQRKTWYLAMRNYFDQHPERLFVVMSTPPLHRLATDKTAAKNARRFANWLKSSEYLSGHPNVVCFDLFNELAKADDGSSTANMLKYEYEQDHSDSDSHPNTLANQTVGPVFAQFLIDAAANY